ncbi:MAG: hypothetical protein EAZ07_00635 [Cytophagales bacterium]|nr:MAG: hypothetical protein EAZ07_00635 [Cytophagales bacterium]
MIQSSGSAAGVDFTSTICQNGNYSVQIMLGNKDLKDGTYSVIPRLSQPKSNEAVIAVVQINNSFQYWSQASGTVTVSGKNMKFNNITLKQYNGDATITISGDYTFK